MKNALSKTLLFFVFFGVVVSVWIEGMCTFSLSNTLREKLDITVQETRDVRASVSISHKKSMKTK